MVDVLPDKGSLSGSISCSREYRFAEMFPFHDPRRSCSHIDAARTDLESGLVCVPAYYCKIR